MSTAPLDPAITSESSAPASVTVAPSIADETFYSACQQKLVELENLYVQARYLDAHRIGCEAFGDDLLQWPTVAAKVYGSRLAGKLGNGQIGRILLHRLTREAADDPASLVETTIFAMQRKPFAHIWLRIRDQDIDTDDAYLQSRWLGLKGRVLNGLRDFDRATPLLEQSIAKMPEHPWPHTNLANALAYKDDVQGAIRVCRDALELAPSFGMAVQALAHYLTQTGKTDEAISLLSNAVNTSQCGSMRLQLSAMHERCDDFDRAAEALDGIEAFFPLLSPERQGRAKRYSLRGTIAAYQSDAAFERGDVETAVAKARYANSEFYDAVADQIEANYTAGRRVRLDVPFVRQDDMTCAPATLAMLSGFWKMDVDHSSIASDICYDGTPANKQRKWAEENGMIVREFGVTAASAQALLDAGIPFAVSTVETGSAHIQVVCGYDSRRSTWWIQDPSSWYHTEWGIKKTLETYAATGPRGLVLIPKDRADLLDGIDLPEVDLYDEQHKLSLALEDHDRETAAQIVQQMHRDAPEHRLTLWTDVMLARYDNNTPSHLDSISKLAAMFPKNESLALSQVRLESQLGRSAEIADRLRSFARDKKASTELLLRLYREIGDASDRGEADRLLLRILRKSGTHPGALSAEARRLWEARDFDDSLELRRLAATTDRRNEQMAKNYIRAATELGREEDVLRDFRQRYLDTIAQSHGPAITYVRALENANQPKKALEAIREALQSRPDDGEFLCEAAAIVGRLADPADGLRMLDEATVPLPPWDHWSTRALLCEYEGRLEATLAAFQELGKISENDAYVVDEISGLLHRLQGIDAAIDYVSGLADKYPHCSHLLGAKIGFLRTAARYDEAIETLDFMLQSHPTDAWAWRERSLIHTRRGNFQAAVDDARQGLVHEHAAKSFSILAGTLIDVGQIDEAKENYRRAIELDADYRFAIAGLMEISDDLEQRNAELAFLLDCLCRQRSNGDGVTEYYEYACAVVDAEELVANLRKLRQSRPDLIETHLALADCLRYRKEFAQAEQTLRDVQERFGHRPILWRDLGEIHLAAGDHEKAREAFQTGFDINPNWADIARSLAKALVKCEQSDQAVAALKRCLQADPSDASLLLALGHTVSDDDEAIEYFKQAGMMDPSWHTPWLELRERCSDIGRHDYAIAAAEELIQQRPSDADSYYRLALMLNQPEQVQASIDAVQQALELNPRDAAMHRVLISRLTDQNKYEEALAACQPADIDPRERIEFDFLAADVLQQMDRKPEALQRLRKALETDPTRHKSLLQLADWAEEIDDHEAYDFAAQMMVKHYPHWHVSHGYIHETHLRRDERDQAIAALHRAVQLDPDYNWAFESLLQLHIEKDELGEATALVQQYADRQSPTKTMGYQLAMAVAQNDCDALLSSIAASELEPDEMRAAARFAAKSFAVDKHNAITDRLSQNLRQTDADPNVAMVWGHLMISSSKLDHAIADFRSFAVSPAWHTAAQELFVGVEDLGQGSDDPAAIARPAFNRLMKTVRRHQLKDPDTWSAVIWAQIACKRYKPAVKLAQQSASVGATQHKPFLAAMIATLYHWSPPVLAKLAAQVRALDQEELTGEVRLMLVVDAIMRNDVPAAETEIAQIKPGDLPQWYANVYHLVASGLSAIQSGDESMLTASYESRFEAEGFGFNRRIHHHLRCLVAKTNGRRLKWIWLKLNPPSK